MGKITPTQRVVLAARKRGALVLTHGQWGSRQKPLYSVRRRLTKSGKWPGFVTKVDTIVLHITVTPDYDDFNTSCQLVEVIGADRFGTGCSYNFMVSMKTGKAAVGQPIDSKGAHTVNDKNVKGFSKDQNLKARAIACIGMPGDKLSSEAVETIVDLMVAMWENGECTDDPDILPHSFFAYKDCPTEAVRQAIPVIKKRFKTRVRRAKLARS